jgi:hypothetical protein
MCFYQLPLHTHPLAFSALLPVHHAVHQHGLCGPLALVGFHQWRFSAGNTHEEMEHSQYVSGYLPAGLPQADYVSWLKLFDPLKCSYSIAICLFFQVPKPIPSSYPFGNEVKTAPIPKALSDFVPVTLWIVCEAIRTVPSGLRWSHLLVGGNFPEPLSLFPVSRIQR